MTRSLSHTELSAALDCQARHAFAYTGRLTGGQALKPRTAAPVLREGRAWGRACAAWHETGSLQHAQAALDIALSLDAAEQQRHGLYSPEEHDEMAAKLLGLLEHYAATASRLVLTRPEHELNVPIPSRTGLRASSLYRLQCFLDGVHTDPEGRDWIVEIKLRRQFQPFELIALNRQTRFYAWAWHRATGRPVAGVIVDERLNAAPAPVKLNKDGTPSKVQTCRLDDYVSAWEQLGERPDEEVAAKLAAKDWQRRHTIVFRPGELEEAGWQLVSGARLIHALDSGEFFPIRNPGPARCPGCPFRPVCADPTDRPVVDALFDRVAPKRDAPAPVAGEPAPVAREEAA